MQRGMEEVLGRESAEGLGLKTETADGENGVAQEPRGAGGQHVLVIDDDDGMAMLPKTPKKKQRMTEGSAGVQTYGAGTSALVID